MAVVAHGGVFSEMLTAHPLVSADTGTAERFHNCELRTCMLQTTCSQNGEKNATGAAETGGSDEAAGMMRLTLMPSL